MNSATKVLGRFTTASIGGTVLGGVGTLMAGAKIALLLPIIMGIVAFAANTINDLLFYIISVSEITDEIKPDVQPQTPS